MSDSKNLYQCYESFISDDLKEQASMFQVIESQLDRETRSVAIYVQSETIVSPDTISLLEEEIKKNLGASKVKIYSQIELVNGDDDVEELWYTAIDEVCKKNHIFYKQFVSESLKIEGEHIHVQIAPGLFGMARHCNLERNLAEIMNKLSGKRFVVTLEKAPAPLTNYRERNDRMTRDAVAMAISGDLYDNVSAAGGVPAPSSAAMPADPMENLVEIAPMDEELPFWDDPQLIAQAERMDQKPTESHSLTEFSAPDASHVEPEAVENTYEEEAPRDEVLYGRPISGKLNDLGSLEENKRVTLMGILSSRMEKEIKGEKILLTFTLTDYQHEVIVKSFIEKDVFAKITDQIKMGQTYLVKGNVKNDDFIHSLTVMANHITLCAAPMEIAPEILEAMDKMIIGMPFEPENVRVLKNLEQLTGTVTVTGDIILHEAEENRSGGMNLTIDINDYTGCITVMGSVDKERYKVISPDLKTGKTIEVIGVMEEDYKGIHKHIRALAIRKSKAKLKKMREDHAAEKRVELHAHTKISEMDAVSTPTQLVKTASAFGHPAVAITDHGVCQGFPEAMVAAADTGIKVLYGVEAYLVDDLQEAVWREKDENLSSPFVVFDIETTGFNKEDDRIIEIGAVKVVNGEITERFSEFVNPQIPIPARITELTSITDEQVASADPIEKVLPRFLEFARDCVFVAHNARFDTGFIETKARHLGLTDPDPSQMAVVDTLSLARGLYTTLKKYTLDAVCKHLGISLENHHRAVDDAEATAGIFKRCILDLRDLKKETLAEVNTYIKANIDVKRLPSHHAIILVQNLKGLRNLYELVSLAHINYFFRTPRTPKSEFTRLREGLILGSACEAGEIYQAVLNNDSPERLEELVNYYDYLEIQPLCNNEFMIRNKTVPDQEALREINRKIIALGKQYNKPVVATCDAHFVEEEQGIYRKIILKGKGFDDADDQAPLYFRTTEEMLKEFDYLGEELAKEVVITNPNKIADMVERFKPIPDGQFAPVIPGAQEELVQICHDKAVSMYGDPLPEPVQARLDRELGSIIKNGFATLYIIAQRLVWHSNDEGYIVGSRGSVGSSFVATMSGITEVNPLKPHYYCPECQYSEFDSEEIRANAGKSGFDLPDKVCPKCGAMLKREGHDIPFETFLGFDGDKEPDIDLNFSGENQASAHAYTEVLFGQGHVFRAGTMTALADKTAYGYVVKYLEEHGQDKNRAEINELVAGCTGARRSTGQHPGGVLVVPKGYTIYDFCPIQYPANKVDAGTITTHFDYNQLHGRLLKLDILGHDDPTMVRYLQDLTGVDARTIPIDNREVLSLFMGTEALGVTPEQIGSTVGTYGIPEFGTRFVRQMLLDTKPTSFSDLVRIAGLSHGTDVWNNNASDLIRDKVATISEVISTRDDIMTYLIRHNMDNLYSFKTMEAVRKGKGLKPADEEAMRAHNVPEWYIKSCKKIKYLFPKGHATAYVMMSLRVAYYKVFYKEAYYAAFFSIRATGFDYETMCQGEDVARAEKARLEALGKEATEKDKDTITTLEIVIEAYCRGVQFAPMSITVSGADRFKLTEEKKLIPPFTSLPGMGLIAAQSIVQARDEAPFTTVEDFMERTKVPKSNVDQMKKYGAFADLPDSMQMSLFEM